MSFFLCRLLFDFALRQPGDSFSEIVYLLLFLFDLRGVCLQTVIYSLVIVDSNLGCDLPVLISSIGYSQVLFGLLISGGSSLEECSDLSLLILQSLNQVSRFV